MLNNAQMASLVSMAKKGKKSAFKELYSATSKSVYFVLLKRLGNETLAMEVLQETYLSAYKNIGKLENEITFIAWINKIAYNLSTDHLKAISKRKVEIEFSEDISDIEDLDSDFIPEEAIIKEEVRQQIMDAIDGLPEAQKACVMMFYYQELSAKEIATVMNTTENSVFKRLQHARHSLKERLAQLAVKGGGFYAMASPNTLTTLLQKEAAKYVTPKVLNTAWAVISTGIAEATPAAGALGAATVKTWVVGVAVTSTVAAVAVVSFVNFDVSTHQPEATLGILTDIQPPGAPGEIAGDFIIGMNEDEKAHGESEEPEEGNQTPGEIAPPTEVDKPEELLSPEELPTPSETVVPFLAQEPLFGTESPQSPMGDTQIKQEEARAEVTATPKAQDLYTEEAESKSTSFPAPKPSDKAQTSREQLYVDDFTMTYEVHKVTDARELAQRIAAASGGALKPGDISDDVLEQFNGTRAGQYVLVIEKEKEFRVTVTVNVVDTIPPVINVERWSLVYQPGIFPSPEDILKDAGVTVTDNSMVPVAAEIYGWDEISGVAGSKYVLRVTAADESGNKALEKKIGVFFKLNFNEEDSYEAP